MNMTKILKEFLYGKKIEKTSEVLVRSTLERQILQNLSTLIVMYLVIPLPGYKSALS